MAKKASGAKGAIPAKKKAAAKKSSKPRKPSAKVTAKKTSSAKSAVKTVKPAAGKEKPLKLKTPSKSTKIEKVVKKVSVKARKKIQAGTKTKKVLPVAAKKREEEKTGKKPEKQTERENQKKTGRLRTAKPARPAPKLKPTEKQQEKKTRGKKAVKPAGPAPKRKQAGEKTQKVKKTVSRKTVKTVKPAAGKQEKKQPAQGKKVAVPKIRKRPEQEKAGEIPLRKREKRQTAQKAEKKKEKVVTPSEKKPLPVKAEKIPKPKEKALAGVKAPMPEVRAPQEIAEVVTKEATGRGEAAGEETEFKTLETSAVSEPHGREEKAPAPPEHPPVPAQADTFPPAPRLSLPAEYGENEIAIIIVEPRKVFLFWEVKESTLSVFHGDLHVRVYDVTGDAFRNIGDKFCLDISVAERIGSIYLDVRPGRDYVADIGILYEDIFITIARSNKAATPRGAAPDEGLLPAEMRGEGQRIGY